MLACRPASVAVALVGAALTFLTSAGVAVAQEPTCEQRGLLPTFKVQNDKWSYSFDNYEHGPEWMVAGQGPGKLVLSRTVEAANSVSVSIEAAIPVISTALGFEVTASVSHSASFELDMPPGPRDKRWFIEAGTRDDVYIYEVQKYCGPDPEGAPIKGRAEKTGHLIYQWWGENPGNPRK
ncbi:hypothetical protein ACU61A_20370 [Pseudonocardia sichuanensis]